MKNWRICLLAALLSLPAIAHAAEADLYCQASGSTWLPCSPSNPLQTTTKLGSYTSVTPSPGTPVSPAQYGLALTAATGLTIPSDATTAVITVEGQPIRCNFDGSATPTASVGTLYAVGTTIAVKLTNFTNFKCIQTASSATIDVDYFK